MTHAVAQREQQDSDEHTTAWWWVRTIASWILLFAMVSVLALLVVLPRVTGSQTYTVLTGSMEPNLSPGTLIFVKEMEPEALEGGDVITFQPESGNPMVNTHRIEMIGIAGDGQRRFVTKGDANETRDNGELVPGQIRGKVWFSVPYLGRVNNALSGESRTIITGVLAGALIVYALWAVGSSIKDRTRKGKEDLDAGTGDGDADRPSASHSEGPKNVDC